MINYKKVAAILSSAVMVGASIGMAAAANFPTPFVVGGTADVAIVYGTGEGVSSLDLIQSGNIQSNLQSYMGAGGTTGTSISGEAAPLFSGGTKIYVNDNLNKVKTVLTKSDLPIVLADASFSGNVDASMTQTIKIGSAPRIVFKKQPTSSDDPNYALNTSTTQTVYTYNATATFNKAVNFSHADSEGESITLFGQKFTVGSATDTDTLVLLKSAEKLSLSSDAPTADVIIDGSSYTIELVSASDSAATIAVTDSSGTTDSKEINEAASKKVNGITIAVTTADETNLKLSASVIAGSDKVTLDDGGAVTVGEDDSIIDGTIVDFGSGNPNNITEITISVYATDSDSDAVKPGESLVDPVYGSFKFDFSGLNIALDSTARETISFTPNGDDKMDITFTDHRGYEKTFTWAKNHTDYTNLVVDDDGRNLSVAEMDKLRYQDYVVVGNEDEGYLLKLSAVKNQTSGFSNDYVKFTDVFSGDTLTTTWSSDGVGTITIGGKSYGVTLEGPSTFASESYNVSLNYPDSSAATEMILFPSIETSKGAKIMFIEPTIINLTDWSSTNQDAETSDLATLKIPDGDGYATLTFTKLAGITVGVEQGWNITDTLGTHTLNTSNATEGINITAGRLYFNFTNMGADNLERNRTKIYLRDVAGVDIPNAAVVIYEEKDDNNVYEALIVELEDGRTGDDGLGIDSVEDTWTNASAAWKSALASDSKKEQRGDLWGSIIEVDSSDSDQKSATISYPDEQIYGQLYIAEESASIIAGQASSSSSTQLGEVLVKDSEVSSVSSKNLIVIGGSCINSAAAKVLGFSGASCGAAFTDSTGIGSGQFLIKGVSGAYTSGKLALVVAGYEAADTVNAAKFLTTQIVDTSKEYKGTSATSATLVTTEA